MYIFFQPQATGEQKTKPTQASVRELRGLGLSPDLVSKYNVQDFAQILYLVGGVRIINRNNVFHSFPDREITCLPCFFAYYCQH
jgi:CTP synthase (UTP-ammonia lyase)